MYIMKITAYSYHDDRFDYFYFAELHESCFDFFKKNFLKRFSDEYDCIEYDIHYYPLRSREFKCRGVLK